MRLNRLDLTRYGKFTGRVLDFGERVPGRPDLHIIYGPNEAGKSTAFAAFLDLLFGIEKQSRFNFMHDYKTMRIGASLELESGPQEFVRIKKPHNSLLAGNEQPVSEGVLTGALGGLDRGAYRVMFSLDDETLEAGGESILESRGDLGQLLFSASAGLADLSRTLDGLKGEAEAFYKYRARSGVLADLKAELATLKAERERIDTLASHYAQLVDARDRSAAQYEEAIAERGAIQARMEEIQRHLTALPRLAIWRARRADIEALGDLPDAPPGWLESLPQLQKDDIELATRAEVEDAKIAQLAAELDAITVDETALALAGRMDDAAELRARHVTAMKDLPDRRLELREAEFAVSGLLSRLGRAGEADPARLVLGASTVGMLRALIEKRSGHQAQMDAAQNELGEARQRLADAAARCEQAGGTPEGGHKRETAFAGLIAALSTVRAGDHAARRRLSVRSAKTRRDALGERMAALRPWAGDADQLAALTVPETADIARWKDGAAKAEQQIERFEDEIADRQAERDRQQAALDAIARTAGIVDDGEAARLRSERNGAWASHRRTLDATTADSFEALLRRDDEITGVRLAHEKERARLAQFRETIAKLDADLTNMTARLKTAQAARDRIDGELTAALAAMTPPLPQETTLARLEGWLALRDKALAAHADLSAASRDLDEIDAGIATAQEALSAGMRAAGLPVETEAGLDALIAAAQAAIDRETTLKELRSALDDRDRELKQREARLEKASSADEAWQTAWAMACRSCWLAESGEVPGFPAVGETLGVLAELGSWLEKQAGLAGRIGKMEKDEAAFEAEIGVIGTALGLDTAKETAAALARRIDGILRDAGAAQAARKAKKEELETARAGRRSLAEALAAHDRRKAEMTAFFQVATLVDVGMRLQDIARRADLRRQAEEAAGDILGAMRMPTIEEAQAVLDAADRSALDAELAVLKGRFEDQDQHSRDLFSAKAKAADQIDAVGGDDAVARLEEKRRTLLLDVEERALRYLRLRMGIAAAEQALRAYRDKHRSSMMARASSAFRTISRNAYSSLTTQLDKDREILIAVSADGGSKVASDLSKGTRFQLYLALRVAGYYEFAEARPPVPFIADDIMETFDDLRAEEAFRLFAEMAGVGQVIYLTHHRHLCDVARRVAPGVQVYDLAAA